MITRSTRRARRTASRQHHRRRQRNSTREPKRDRNAGSGETSPIRAPRPAPPAASRTRSAASCRRVRRRRPLRLLLARAPCRRSGKNLGHCCGSPDASGRCRSSPGAGSPPVPRRADISPGRQRNRCGSRLSRTDRGLSLVAMAIQTFRRIALSCRTPDRWRRLRRANGSNGPRRYILETDTP